MLPNMSLENYIIFNSWSRYFSHHGRHLDDQIPYHEEYFHNKDQIKEYQLYNAQYLCK